MLLLTGINLVSQYFSVSTDILGALMGPHKVTLPPPCFSCGTLHSQSAHCGGFVHLKHAGSLLNWANLSWSHLYLTKECSPNVYQMSLHILETKPAFLCHSAVFFVVVFVFLYLQYIGWHSAVSSDCLSRHRNISNYNAKSEALACLFFRARLCK